jgi:hypothetical protein
MPRKVENTFTKRMDRKLNQLIRIPTRKGTNREGRFSHHFERRTLSEELSKENRPPEKEIVKDFLIISWSFVLKFLLRDKLLVAPFVNFSQHHTLQSLTVVIFLHLLLYKKFFIIFVVSFVDIYRVKEILHSFQEEKVL